MLRPLHRVSFFLAALAVLFGTLTIAHVQSLNHSIKQQVLRLHIVANSDSPYDQAIKLQVRDRILKDCSHLFSHCNSAEDAARVARQNTAQFITAAKKELLRLGVLQPVTMQVTACDFPTKNYGKVRLPAGEYTAVNLRIGTGQGQNWWCVMYPPLCLTGESVAADEETLNMLRSQLSQEEYALVTEPKNTKVQVKFKLAELLGRWF